MDLSRIDEDIFRHRLALSNLCALRNSVSPIYRLPNELLASVFIHNARDHYSNGQFPSARAPPWANVSYVCSHWRNVALNCPMLWSYIFTLPDGWTFWTEMILARSARAPLKIRIEVEHTQGLWLVRKLMCYGKRIEELRVDFYKWNEDTRLAFLTLFSRTPCLRCLEISMENLIWDHDIDIADAVSFTFHSDILVPQSYIMLGSLTSLSLQSIPSTTQQGLGNYLTTLRCTQNLAELQLHDVLPSSRDFISSVEFKAFEKINLPRLAHLSITAPLSTMIAFLSCVNFPARTKTKLTCRDDRPRDSSSLYIYSQFCSVLVQKRDKDWACSAPTIRSVAIRFDSNAAWLVFCQSTECDYDPFLADWDLNKSIPLMIVLCFTSESEWSGEATDIHKISFVSDILSSMPVTNVQSLHVIGLPNYPIFWRKTLGHLPGLQRIKLNEGFMPDLASVLLPKSPAPHEPLEETSSGHAASDLDLDHILAPRLQELELYQIEFSIAASSVDSNQRFTAPFAGADLQSFYDALSTRIQSRIRVTLTDCVVDGVSRSSTSEIWVGGGKMFSPLYRTQASFLFGLSRYGLQK